MTITNAQRQDHDEYQYLDLIRRVLDTGDTRPDRTGTGTIAIFAPPSTFFPRRFHTASAYHEAHLHARYCGGITLVYSWLYRFDPAEQQGRENLGWQRVEGILGE